MPRPLFHKADAANSISDLLMSADLPVPANNPIVFAIDHPTVLCPPVNFRLAEVTAKVTVRWCYGVVLEMAREPTY